MLEREGVLKKCARVCVCVREGRAAEFVWVSVGSVHCAHETEAVQFFFCVCVLDTSTHKRGRNNDEKVERWSCRMCVCVCVWFVFGCVCSSESSLLSPEDFPPCILNPSSALISVSSFHLKGGTPSF